MTFLVQTAIWYIIQCHLSNRSTISCFPNVRSVFSHCSRLKKLAEICLTARYRFVLSLCAYNIIERYDHTGSIVLPTTVKSERTWHHPPQLNCLVKKTLTSILFRENTGTGDNSAWSRTIIDQLNIKNNSGPRLLLIQWKPHGVLIIDTSPKGQLLAHPRVSQLGRWIPVAI